MICLGQGSLRSPSASSCYCCCRQHDHCCHHHLLPYFSRSYNYNGVSGECELNESGPAAMSDVVDEAGWTWGWY